MTIKVELSSGKRNQYLTVLEILARQLGTAIAYKEMHHKEGK